MHNQASIHENVSANEYQAKRNPIMHAILNALLVIYINSPFNTLSRNSASCQRQ